MRSNYISSEQVRVLLPFLSPNVRLACEVMLHTGLRVGDVLELRSAKLSRRMTVRERKTGKSRRVRITSDLLQRMRKNGSGSVWAFPGRDPLKHLTRQAVWFAVKKAAVKNGISVNVSPHSLRKSYAVELLRRYGDVGLVQRSLNHDRLETTLVYALSDQTWAQKKSHSVRAGDSPPAGGRRTLRRGAKPPK